MRARTFAHEITTGLLAAMISLSSIACGESETFPEEASCSSNPRDLNGRFASQDGIYVADLQQSCSSVSGTLEYKDKDYAFSGKSNGTTLTWTAEFGDCPASGFWERFSSATEFKINRGQILSGRMSYVGARCGSTRETENDHGNVELVRE